MNIEIIDNKDMVKTIMYGLTEEEILERAKIFTNAFAYAYNLHVDDEMDATLHFDMWFPLPRIDNNSTYSTRLNKIFSKMKPFKTINRIHIPMNVFISASSITIIKIGDRSNNRPEYKCKYLSLPDTYLTCNKDEIYDTVVGMDLIDLDPNEYFEIISI